MASKGELLIDDLVKTLEGAVDDFDSKVPELQSKMYKEALDLVSELETTSSRPKKLKVSLKNARIMARIRSQMQGAIVNDSYIKEVDSFLKTWDKVDKINGQYFSTITTTWKPSTVFAELKKQSLEAARERLLGTGISGSIVNRVNDILLANITTGGTYADFTEQLRTFLVTDENGDGALQKYSGQIVNDSISIYNSQYQQLATQDLGLTWYMYVGTLKKTSRAFCKALIDAKQDCMPFIHQSQIAEIVKGRICGKQVPLNEKTGLPEGMRPNTNSSNFIDYKGGYRCNHALIGVDEAIVPDELVKKYG